MAEVTDELVNTLELARMLKIHQFTVGKMFWLAYRDRVKQQACYKRYSLARVAELISEVSGFTVEPDDLRDLVKRDEGIQILADQGKPRCVRSWLYWQRHEIGPRPIRIGSAIRYVRSEIIEWADQLSANPARGRVLGVTAAQGFIANGPNAANSSAIGAGGVGHLSYLPESEGA